MLINRCSLEKVERAAAELSKATGQKCLYASVDVRHKDKLQATVAKCIAEFGRIDFVICGTVCFVTPRFPYDSSLCSHVEVPLGISSLQ